MNIGDEIIVGKMGEQMLTISDPSVNPKHALLRKTGKSTYQIDDLGSTKGIFVFGMRIKRKTIKEETPILLGNFKTTVRQLLQDTPSFDLDVVWDAYDKEKRLWDRKNLLVNYLRIIPSILAMVLGMLVGQEFNSQTRMMITMGMTISVLVISMILSERIMAKKNMRMAELNAEMQHKYVCPHCHKFLSFTPYQVLKKNIYCPNPNCNYPLP